MSGEAQPGPDPEEDDGVQDLYVDGLRRSQLGLSLLSLVALAGLVGALPLAALVAPALDGVTFGQVPLVALLPLIPLPAFVLVGLLHSRRAEGLDDAFASIDDDPDAPAAGPSPRPAGRGRRRG